MVKPLIASYGIMSLQGVQTIPTDGTPISEIIKIVIQLIIGGSALFQLFKKPKEVITNQNLQP
ncbi:hypothetical protein [Flavobacterium sp. XS2P39]|uniref:hypothetical protein n=1 Tax=Flavobacterium sp. XS2P39 TaxID=3401725 RepID=UPI003AAE72EB